MRNDNENAQTCTITGTSTSQVLPGTICSCGKPAAAFMLITSELTLRSMSQVLERY
jgi:hypothetical protein